MPDERILRGKEGQGRPLVEGGIDRLRGGLKRMGGVGERRYKNVGVF